MSYVELGNDLLRFMLSLGFVTVPAVEVEPFEFGIFNHKKRKNSQKPGTGTRAGRFCVILRLLRLTCLVNSRSRMGFRC